MPETADRSRFLAPLTSAVRALDGEWRVAYASSPERDDCEKSAPTFDEALDAFWAAADEARTNSREATSLFQGRENTKG